ncbi:MAG TPA: SufE family protein [Caulobacterales bacterium]|nr:SufE family protein [Caulobacterales bacterium]
MSATIDTVIEDIAEEFSLFSDWEERYARILELADELAPLSAAEHNEATKVRGCASQVWLVSDRRPEAPGHLYFRGDSDAHLVRGLIALLLRVYSGRTPAEILSIDPRAMFERLGLKDALTPQRSNGLFSMMERIRRYAAEAAAS